MSWHPGVRWRGKDEPVKVVPKDSEAVPETSLQLAETLQMEKRRVFRVEGGEGGWMVTVKNMTSIARVAEGS